MQNKLFLLVAALIVVITASFIQSVQASDSAIQENPLKISEEFQSINFETEGSMASTTTPGGNCTNPRDYRSCAFHCADSVRCHRCCLDFADSEFQFGHCRARCRDVFTSVDLDLQ